jgi:flagellar protein FlgJ
MSNAIPQNANVYTEVSSLKALKGQVKSGDQDAIEKVAKQFEAIFLQMMLSGMRKTIQVDDEYSNDKAMYYDLFDKQVAMNLSEKGGIGLARIMMSQSGMGISGMDKEKHVHGTQAMQPSIRQSSISPVQSDKTVNGQISIRNPAKNNIQTENTNVSMTAAGKIDEREKAAVKFGSPVEFMQTVWNVARDVIVESGFDPKVLIAQAALETGWGKHIIQTAKGQSSFNLFGIKSGQQWSGDEVVANTLEYKDGAMYKAREGFRAYDSIRDSVRDYIDFLKGNQRYKRVLQQLQNPEAYMKELQNAGYATDPQYANKVLKIMDSKDFGQFFATAGMQET